MDTYALKEKNRAGEMDDSVSRLLAAQASGPGFDAQLLHERLGMGART